MVKHMEPELGHWIFGNAWQTYEANGTFDEILRVLELVIRKNNKEENLSSGYGVEFVNNIFEMHPYYWGDCTCGYEKKECEWEEKHPHKEDCFYTQYHAEEDRLRAEKCEWREAENRMISWAKKIGFKNAPYGMAVYCDCGKQKEWKEWSASNQHDERCPVVLPNFIYKPLDIWISWYKYIGRDMSCNVKVPNETVIDIMQDCLKSLGE